MIHYLCIPVARQRGDDPGEAVAGHFKVEGNTVLLCTENGTPTGERRAIGNDPARVVAARMLKRRWMDAKGANDFNRPLSSQDYQKVPC